MGLSFWERSFLYNQRDLTIVGAGLGGLNLALAMKEREPSLSIRVLEAGTLSFGASTKNAGFFCFGSPSEILDDADRSGWEKALNTVSERWKGLQRCRNLFKDGRIGLQWNGGHEMFFDRELFEETHNRLSSLNSSLEALLGHTPYRVMSTEEMDRKGSKGFEAGISIEGEGMLNPYKLHGALLERVRSLGVEVLFGFELETVRNEGNACELKLKGYDTPLQSPRTVLACNGFTEKLLPGTDIAPARGQILITGPLGNLPIEGAFHMDRGDLYFRNVGTRVLLGGGRSLEVDKEGTREQGLNQRIQEELECLLEERILPGRSYLIEDRWSGIMGFSPDKMPKLQAVDERIFLMAGFSGMGVALSFSAGERMAEQILG